MPAAERGAKQRQTEGSGWEMKAGRVGWMEPSHGLLSTRCGVREGESETSPAPKGKQAWNSVARRAILSASIKAQGSLRPPETAASKVGQGSSNNDHSYSLLNAHVLVNRTFRGDGNVPYLHRPVR